MAWSVKNNILNIFSFSDINLKVNCYNHSEHQIWIYFAKINLLLFKVKDIVSLTIIIEDEIIL